MKELIIRLLIGGFVVSVFSVISDVLKPKTFAGLFGAAPSVALASLALTVLMQGTVTVATEARSMIFGAAALFIYGSVMSRVMLRFRPPALPVFLPGLLLWLAVAVGLWYVVLGV